MFIAKQTKNHTEQEKALYVLERTMSNKSIHESVVILYR